MIMKCNWCKGIGKVKLLFRGEIICLNCNGTGEGPDGGKRKIKGGRMINMMGNKYACKKSKNI